MFVLIFCGGPIFLCLTCGNHLVALVLYAIVQAINVIGIRLSLGVYQALLRSNIDQVENNFKEWNVCMDSKHQMNINFVKT